MPLSPRAIRSVRVLLLVLVAAYGALLRLDAISAKFDPVRAPRWLHDLQIARTGPSALRPAGMHWEMYPRVEHKDGPPSQYKSDPYTYLQYARQMHAFYAAHRREPLFPFATKIWLWLLHGDDSAVSFAAGAFSVLAIVLTFALGREAFSYPVGLVAALFWAIEFDAISSGTEGWRDDAFTCAVLLTAWCVLRFAREPDGLRAILLGAAGGAACLVRITSLSFVVPALASVLLVSSASIEQRRRYAALATLATMALLGPFLVNSWRVFGDPFYAINVHAGVYQATEGQAPQQELSAREYIGTHVRRRPVETLDTFVLGLTQYPFANKWTGLVVWHPFLSSVLPMLAIAGLLIMAATAPGRLLLVLLLASLVPYALTWRLIADWRFTQHAYPFFLIAACSPIWMISRLVESRGAVLRDRAAMIRAMATGGAAAAVALILWFVFTRVTPGLAFEETVRGGEPATILAGDRDAAYFGSDWPRLARHGAIVTRVADGARATVVVPLPAAVDYDMLLRVDPSTEPLRPGVAPARIQLLLNGRLLGSCDPGSSPDRIGICRAVLPADGIRAGGNKLTLVTDGGPGFRVWYVRVTKKSA